MIETQTHKTSINIPIDLFSKLKEESKALGINLNALILIKIQELEKQNYSLEILNRVLNEIEQMKS